MATHYIIRYLEEEQMRKLNMQHHCSEWPSHACAYLKLLDTIMFCNSNSVFLDYVLFLFAPSPLYLYIHI